MREIGQKTSLNVLGSAGPPTGPLKAEKGPVLCQDTLDKQVAHLSGPTLGSCATSKEY